MGAGGQNFRRLQGLLPLFLALGSLSYLGFGLLLPFHSDFMLDMVSLFAGPG